MVSYPAVHYALALNQKLDKIVELHKDKDTVHEIRQARQLIDDLFADCLEDCTDGAQIECHSEQDSHTAEL